MSATPIPRRPDYVARAVLIVIAASVTWIGVNQPAPRAASADQIRIIQTATPQLPTSGPVQAFVPSVPTPVLQDASGGLLANGTTTDTQDAGLTQQAPAGPATGDDSQPPPVDDPAPAPIVFVPAPEDRAAPTIDPAPLIVVQEDDHGTKSVPERADRHAAADQHDEHPVPAGSGGSGKTRAPDFGPVAPAGDSSAAAFCAAAERAGTAHCIEQAAADAYRDLPVVPLSNDATTPNRFPMPRGAGTR